jgi:hypothetical protein
MTARPVHRLRLQAIATLGPQVLRGRFDGIFYAARYDPSFTERSVAVFGNEEFWVKLFEVVTQPIPAELVEAASQQFGFTVNPSAPLL